MASDRDQDPTDELVEGYGCLKPPTIFRGKLSQLDSIPCLRSSALNGIYAGMTVGLIHYAFKSNLNRANLYAGCTFSLVLLTNWFLCRSNYVNDNHTLNLAREKMMEYIDKRGEMVQYPVKEGKDVPEENNTSI